MDKVIIYSFKEYQEKYSSSLDKYFLQYEEIEEIEEIDFIINEIEKYNICLQIINFPIHVAFNRFFRIEYGSNLKTFSIPQEIFDFIFANENADYYYKIYRDLIGSTIQSPSSMEDGERKIIQTRLIFSKIISFLETKKSELETPIPQTVHAPGNTKQNKSLMLGGEKLNISERYKILNRVLDFDKKVHPLNIREQEKYQLLAYILGIDKDNARKIMNGSHDSKDRNDILDIYFNELGLNK